MDSNPARIPVVHADPARIPAPRAPSPRLPDRLPAHPAFPPAPARRCAAPFLSLALGVALPLVLSGCAGATGAVDRVGVDGEWERLLEPRPAPLAGAPRVAVSGMHLLPPSPWEIEDPLPTPVGLLELMSAGLLRRRDVVFVERRRFAAAAERVRRGERRPPGAPRVGRSPGAELFLTASWAPDGSGTTALDLRLVDATTGDVVATARETVPDDLGPVGRARATVAALLDVLRREGRLPTWDAAPPMEMEEEVPVRAVAAFFRGVRAEDRYDWSAARTAYEEAARLGGPAFYEPRVALARVARLRAGGSLAGS